MLYADCGDTIIFKGPRDKLTAVVNIHNKLMTSSVRYKVYKSLATFSESLKGENHEPESIYSQTAYWNNIYGRN